MVADKRIAKFSDGTILIVNTPQVILLSTMDDLGLINESVEILDIDDNIDISEKSL